MLGKTESSRWVPINMQSSDCLVSEVLTELRRHPGTVINRILNSAERSGSRTFLALSPNGPIRLEEQKRLSDYQLIDDCTVWLMCSHEPCDDTNGSR